MPGLTTRPGESLCLLQNHPGRSWALTTEIWESVKSQRKEKREVGRQREKGREGVVFFRLKISYWSVHDSNASYPRKKKALQSLPCCLWGHSLWGKADTPAAPWKDPGGGSKASPKQPARTWGLLLTAMWVNHLGDRSLSLPQASRWLQPQMTSFSS